MARHKNKAGIEKSEASVCAVVGVGASAGGLEALRRLCASLPPDSPFALVIVQHLDPSQPSRLSEILAETCTLKVIRAEDGQLVKSGAAYVVPEAVEVRLEDRRLRFSPRSSDCHDPIDTFFFSLAGHSGAYGCGVLLSGEGSDGALGLREIRGAGGITLVQDPATAEHAAMPGTAIESGAADFVGSPEDIAAELLQAVRHPRFGASRARTKGGREQEELALGRVLTTVRKVCGMDFSAYKPTTVMRRVSRRIMLRDVESLEAYARLIESEPAEAEALVDDMLINVTEFFRDPEVFDSLRTRVFPDLLADKTDGDTLRIWVAGCSTGEEVYSVLITALEAIETAGVACNVTVFGTDASDHAVRRARAGQYAAGTCSRLSPERLARYFVPTPDGYEVSRVLRDMCVFARQDITKDTPFSRLDVVTLRNVLIYMDQSLQKNVLDVAHFALSPNGFLVLGTSETPESESRLFKTYDKAHHVYRRKNVTPRLPFDVANALPVDIDSFAVPDRPFGELAERSDLRAEAAEMTLLLYAPPRVVVDGDGHIVHFFGDTSPYLEHPEGRATFDLREMALSGIALEVKEALDESVASGGAASREATFGSDGDKRRVAVEVTPLPAPGGSERRLVAFRELPFEAGPFGAATSGDDLSRLYESREDRFRTELSALRSRLRAISEEKDRANQGLRVANEESRSSNEELRSINEELETAKEELQSANEELITVNDELRQSNRDLAVVNTDIENFMESTGIPVLMLDCDLKVRRFTPQASRVVHVEPDDRGRQLSRLRFRVDVPDIEELAREVLSARTEISREVRDSSGHWYSMHLHPYMTRDGVVDGVVVAFLDVDELRQSVERIRRRSELNRALNEIDVDIASTLEPDEILKRSLDAGVRALGVEAGAIAMRDADGWIVGAQVGSPTSDVGTRLSPDDARIALRVGELRELIVIDDVTANADVNMDFAAKRGVKSIMAVPLIAREEVIGSLLLFARAAARTFTTSERDFVLRLAASVSLAIDNARLIEAERDAARRAMTLNAINEIIRSTTTTDDLLERLADEVSAVAGADRSMVVEARGESYLVTHARNVRDGVLGHTGVPEEYPAFAEAAQTQRPVLIGDTWADARTNKDFVVPYELRAFQLLPLVVGNRTEAVLALAWGTPQSFNAEDQSSAERFAVAMSVALSNARLYESECRAKEAEAERAKQLESIHEIATLTASTLSTVELSQRVLDNLGERFALSQASVYLVDRENDALVPVAAFGVPLHAMPSIGLDSDFPTAQAFNDGEPKFAENASAANSRTVESTRKKLQSLTGRQLKAYCVIPLHGYRAPLGTLTLSWPTNREFGAEDVDFFTSIGHEVAIGLENARLFEAEVEAQCKASQELEFTQVLLDSSAALAEWTEVRPMLERLADVLLRSAAHSRVTIGLWDEHRKELTVVASKGEHAMAGVTTRLDEMSGPARRMIRSKKSVLIDYSKVKDEALRKVVAKRNLRFALVAPIVARGRLLGSITVDAPGEHLAFSERESALIESVAGQAARAIDNGRLFESEVTAQRSATSALEVTSQLLDAARALAGWTELSGVLDQLAKSVHIATGRKRVFVHRWDAQRPALVLAASAGIGSAPLGSRYEWDQIAAPSKRVLTQKRAMILDYDKIRSAEKKPYAGPMGFRVALAVPLVERSTLVGLLIVDDPGERHEFEPLEIEIVQGIAAQASAAIRTARSFEAEQAELVRTTVLKDVTAAAASTLDLSELAQRVLDVCHDLLGAKSGSIYVIDDEAGELMAAALFGFPKKLMAQMGRMDLDEQRAAARSYLRREVVMHDSPGLPGGIAKRAKAANALDNRWISLPICARGEVLGSLGLIFEEQRAFTADEIALYESLAAQLGTGVDKSRLFEAEQARRKRIDVLREVSALAISSLEPGQAADAALEFLSGKLGVAAASLWTIDSSGERLFPIGGFGFPSEFFEDFADGVAIDAPFVVAQAFTEGRAVAHANAKGDSVPAPVRDAYARHGVALESLLVLPLVGRSSVFGAVTFVWDSPHTLDEAEVEYWAAIVNALSAGLEITRLFDRTLRSSRLDEALNFIDAEIHSTLDFEEIMQRALDRGVEALGCDAGTIETREGAGWRVRFQNGFSRKVAGRLLTEAEAPNATRAMLLAEPIVVTGMTSDEVANVGFVAQHGLRTALAVPLIVQDEVTGCLLFYERHATGTFDDLAVDFGRKLGASVSLALANSELVQNLESTRARVTSIVESISDGFYALDREWRFTYANAEAGRMMGVPADTLIGRTIGEALDDPERLEFQKRTFGPAMYDGQPVALERLFPQTGIWSEIHVYPSADGVVVYGRDITERRAAERELEQAHQRLTNVLDSMTDGFVSVDREWRYTLVNPKAEEMLRMSAEDLLGKSMEELFPDMLGWPHYRDVMDKRVPETFEVWSKPLRVWLEVHAYPNEEGMSILFVDITQRKADAEALRRQNAVLGAINSVLSLALISESEEELAAACLAEAEQLTGSAFGFIAEIDESGSLRDIALSGPDRSGSGAPDESGEDRPSSGFAAHGRYGRVVLDRTAFFTNDPENHPGFVDTPQGHPVLESYIGVPLMSRQRLFGMMALANREGGYSDSELEALEAFAPAVVESLLRKRAESTLALSRQRSDMLATLLDEAAQPFGVGDPSGGLLLVNEAFEALTGYSADELRDVSWAEDLTPPEYIEYESEQLAELARTGQPVRYEKEYIRKDGVKVPVELLVNVQKTDDGDVAYYYSFVTDLSDRKQRERLESGLNIIGADISSTLDRDEVLSRLHEGVCRTLRVDACGVATLEAGQWVLKHVQGASAEQLTEILEAGRVADLPVNDEDRFGPILFDDVAEAKSVAALADVGVKRLLIAPLLTGGQVTGAIAVAQTTSEVPFSEAQVDFVTRLMPLGTLALENAELYQRERTIADTLQEAILVAPAQIAGLESAHIYRPASAMANVGGDFYDVFELPDGKVGIVTGDVSGKGLDAARLTSLFHDGIRAYAYESADPGDVLTRLNRLVHTSSPPESYATLFFGVLDVATGKMRYCTGGHPSPAVVNADGAVYLASTRSPVLGAFGGIVFSSAETILLPKEKLVLFTDGVTEARNGEGKFFGEEGVLHALAKLRRSRVENLPTKLVDAVLEYADGHLRDDTVVLAVMRTPAAEKPA